MQVGVGRTHEIKSSSSITPRLAVDDAGVSRYHYLQPNQKHRGDAGDRRLHAERRG